MPYNLVGKILFPGRSRPERIKKAKGVIGVMLVALVLGGCVGFFLYLQYSHQK